jgi:FkbM family methyltransferase
MLATLRFILNHPLNQGASAKALLRYARWQVGSHLLPGAVAVPFVGSSRLLVRPGMTGATGNVYCGLHEFEEMAFVLHALRPEDVFADIGANVGSYTILAAGCAGASAVAIEPVPSTAVYLRDNVRLNGLESKVTVLQVALGASAGVVAFSTHLDTTNRVLTAADTARASETAVHVPVLTLDEALGSTDPAVIKLDVEGYETAVLAGASRVLASPRLRAIVMELNGSGARYGHSDDALHAEVLRRGFMLCRYEPFTRELTPAEARPVAGNGLYVRDFDGMRERLASAQRYRVLDRDL